MKHNIACKPCQFYMHTNVLNECDGAITTDKSQIPLRYLVRSWFEAGSKLVADLQRAEIWPII